jgi:hypothetical protein
MDTYHHHQPGPQRPASQEIAVPKRSRDRRNSTIAHLAARVDRLTGGRNCTSLLTVVGVLNRCPGRCLRCEDLVCQHEAAAPEREQARRQYDLAHPGKAARAPTPLDDDEEL